MESRTSQGHSRLSSISLSLATELPLLLMLLLVAAHAYLIESTARLFLSIENQFLVLVIKHGLPIIGGFVLLHYLATKARSKSTRALLFTIELIVLLTYLIDLMIYKLFFKRLDLHELYTFGSEFQMVLDVGRPFFKNPDNAYLTILLLAILSAPAAFIFTNNRNPAPRQSKIRLVLAFLMIGSIYLKDDIYSTSRNAYINIVEYQYINRPPKRYSNDLIAEVATRRPSVRRCIPGLNKRNSIVLVIMESLSSYHSRHFSGLNDWVPRIDAFAQAHLSYPQHFANGFRTDLGMIAVVTGQDPLPPDDPSKTLFDAHTAAPQAISRLLKPSGYRTGFFSAGDLDFLGMGTWLQSLGFDTVRGPEHPSFLGVPKAAAGSVPDVALYRHVEEWLSQQTTPALAVVSTLSTHVPFYNPETNERGEAAAFSYADKAFDGFIRALRERHFFERGGVVVLTGDHRALTPVASAEFDRFGDSAPARIPLIVIGDHLPQQNTVTGAPFQQTDIAPSLSYLTGAEACFSSRQRNLFAEHPESGRCIFHARGDQTNLVTTYCPDKTATVRLDGDDTNFIGHPPKNSQAILDELVKARLNRP